MRPPRWFQLRLFALPAILGLAFLGFGQEAQKLPTPSNEKLPKPVAPQPVAFSHRVHAGKVGLPCELCHKGISNGDDAGIALPRFCMTCHKTIKADSPEVAKVKTAAENGQKIPWVPVYRVPDFVFFSHASHVGGGVDCATCHGPVATRDVLKQEVSTKMNSCRDCHRLRNAPMDCAACHQLGH